MLGDFALVLRLSRQVRFAVGLKLLVSPLCPQTRSRIQKRINLRDTHPKSPTKRASRIGIRSAATMDAFSQGTVLKKQENFVEHNQIVSTLE